jgi:hypothetical protein
MNKKNLILLLILLFFLALAGIYQYFWLPQKNISGRQDNWLAKINFAAVNKIEIKLNGQTTTLNKEGERWRVAGDGQWYVNGILADNFARAWQTAASSSLFIVSTDKDAKADFKTDGSFTLKLSANKIRVADLAIGLTRSGYTYIAPADSNISYEVGSDLRSAFDYEEWRDLNIFNADSNKINQIKITQGKNSLTLKKEGTVWQVADNAKLKLNQDKVARIASLMGELSANAIPDQKSKDTGLDKNTWTVEATGEGIKNVLIIGKEEVIDKQPSGNLFVKSAVSPNIYLLGKNIAGVFQVNLKDLIN